MDVHKTWHSEEMAALKGRLKNKMNFFEKNTLQKKRKMID